MRKSLFLRIVYYDYVLGSGGELSIHIRHGTLQKIYIARSPPISIGNSPRSGGWLNGRVSASYDDPNIVEASGRFWVRVPGCSCSKHKQKSEVKVLLHLF